MNKNFNEQDELRLKGQMAEASNKGKKMPWALLWNDGDFLSEIRQNFYIP